MGRYYLATMPSYLNTGIWVIHYPTAFAAIARFPHWPRIYGCFRLTAYQFQARSWPLTSNTAPGREPSHLSRCGIACSSAVWRSGVHCVPYGTLQSVSPPARSHSILAWIFLGSYQSFVLGAPARLVAAIQRRARPYPSALSCLQPYAIFACPARWGRRLPIRDDGERCPTSHYG